MLFTYSYLQGSTHYLNKKELRKTLAWLNLASPEVVSAQQNKDVA